MENYLWMSSSLPVVYAFFQHERTTKDKRQQTQSLRRVELWHSTMTSTLYDHWKGKTRIIGVKPVKSNNQTVSPSWDWWPDSRGMQIQSILFDCCLSLPTFTAKLARKTTGKHFWDQSTFLRKPYFYFQWPLRSSTLLFRARRQRCQLSL
jgi:hypothetical protein